MSKDPHTQKSDDSKQDDLFSKDTSIPGADKDLLAELRAKTAELASKVRGSEPAGVRILKLDDESVSEQDIDRSMRISSEDKNEHPIRSLKEEPGDKPVDPALSLIREKLSKIYKEEPDAEEEAIEAYNVGKNRSVHQQFMYDLTTSGKSLADIQTEWHNYYVNLPEEQKHEVWREFYTNQRSTSHYAAAQNLHTPIQKPEAVIPEKEPPKAEKHHFEANISAPIHAPMSVQSIKDKIHSKVTADGRLKPVHHVKSLLFGLGLAGVVGLIIMFTFFNQVFIAPFISPSQTVSATPILGNASEVGPESKIIIPKINLEVPVVFNLGSVQEEDIQNALEDGVVHFASSPNPGEVGNSVIVGHSSNNILNSGKYKFAFVLLKRLEIEDTFFVQKDGVRYTYKIYKKEIVPPDAVEVLETQDKPNTITLVTCDPPGTTINRLIIVAEQITPDPAGNTESTAPDIPEQQTELPSAAPSLWSRIWPL